MRVRSGFVSNSSSCSFTINKRNLTNLQMYLIDNIKEAADHWDARQRIINRESPDDYKDLFEFDSYWNSTPWLREDDDNNMKWGYLTPGMNIPIHGINLLDQPFEKICFIPLAWNFYSEIKERIQQVRNTDGDIFIKYFPEYQEEQ